MKRGTYMSGYPEKQGLYDPAHEKDACGVGFIVNVNGNKTPSIVENGLLILKRMAHRGAVGADPKTGDGAGILIQTPHDFFVKAASEIKINLPAQGEYGTGLIFLPLEKNTAYAVKKEVEKAAKECGQEVLGWRNVPVNKAVLGETAKASCPDFVQVL